MDSGTQWKVVSQLFKSIAIPLAHGHRNTRSNTYAKPDLEITTAVEA